MSQGSNSRKVGKIRDVVHDYIEITSIENDIINTKEFQRLRYICQNSLAYYTYPSNTTNRFSHSLGVMHIGGLFFTKALENSDKTTLLEFIKQCKELIETVNQEHNSIKDLFDDWIDLFGNISDFNHHPSNLTKPEWFTNKESLAIINIMWQSVRIACLVHDIGHFPFSHLFEHALEDFTNSEDSPIQTSIKSDIHNQRREYVEYYKNLLKLNHDLDFTEQPALHEVKGVSILKNFKPLRELNDTKKRDLTLLCLKLAKIIFIHNKSALSDQFTSEVNNVVESLHAIVSSEIDADRLDYCMRDPNASGIELGAYDLKRIVDASVLIKAKDGRFKIAFSLNGASGIEAFFHQRFLMYEYLIYHHNVARFDASLESTISLVLRMFSSNEIVKEEALKFGIIKENQNQKFSVFDSLPFYHYDDYWFKTFLSQLYYRFTNDDYKGKSINEFSDIYNLICLLEIVLFRNNNHVFSYWKRPFDFYDEIEKVQSVLKEKGNNSSTDEIVNKLNILTDPKSETAKKNIFELRNVLAKKGVYLLIKSVKKKIFAIEESKRVEIICPNGDLKPAYEVSPYLKSLKTNTENSIGFNLFIVGKDIKQNKELLEEVKKDLINQFVNIIIK